jgi:hypothetical protein
MKNVLMATVMFFPIVIFALAVVIADGSIQFVNYVSEALKEILNESI